MKMNLYRQHSDDLNAYLFHHKKGRSSRAGAAAAAASERHECCERPIPTPPQHRWCPAPPPPPPIRHGCHSAPNHRRRDPGFAAATLPRSLAMPVDVPGGESGVGVGGGGGGRMQISSRQNAQVFNGYIIGDLHINIFQSPISPRDNHKGLIQLGKNPGENPGENPDETPI